MTPRLVFAHAACLGRLLLARRHRHASLAALALLLAALAMLGRHVAAAGAGDPSALRVARPGMVLLAPAQRQAELEAMTPDQVRALCGVPPDSWPSHRAITTIKAPESYGSDLRVEPFALTVMRSAGVAFGEDDGDAATALAALLDRWARGKAMTRFDKRDANSYYTINRALFPTIVAWSLVRDDPGIGQPRRKRIEAWLERVVELRGKRPDQDAGNVSARNNHSYLEASVDMAWGALRGDQAAFRNGIAAYRRALGQMRADGSLPLETERGARALWYQRHAIASLVVIAEMAAVQGYDLYGLEVRERSLHDAIRFLLDAIDDPSLVAGYAAANVKPGPDEDPSRQDLGFLVERGHDRHYMAWAEIYIRRFPDRPEARDLLALLRRADPGFRPMIDEYSGGNTSCLFARHP